MREPLSRETPDYEHRLDQAAAFLREHDDFLVVSHLHPDGDAVSSTLVVGELLRQLGKSYTLINEGPIPAKFYRLPGADRIVDGSESKAERSYSKVISVDCADFSRIGAVVDRFAADYQLLNIDHHPTNDRFGMLALVRDDAAATVEVLYDLAVRLDARWDLSLCESLYTGLLTDTGGFRYANTSPKVMNIAAFLLDKGVPGSELAERFLERMSPAQILLLQKALSSLHFAFERRVAYVAVTSEEMAACGASNEDLDGIVNYPRNIEGVEVGLLLKQTGSSVFKASLRSNGSVDVARICQGFGGGGHVRAAGCTLNGTQEEAIKQLLDQLGEALA